LTLDWGSGLESGNPQVAAIRFQRTLVGDLTEYVRGKLSDANK
jgi:hypothetical protein